MEISFEGIGQVAATFAVDGAVEPGMAVALTGDSTVGAGEAEALPCGVVLSVREDMAAVQIAGLAQVGYSGTAPEAGWVSVACDGAGKLKTVTSGGMSCLVVSVDTAAKTAVIKL